MENQKEKAITAAVGEIEKQFGKGAIMRLGADQAPAKVAVISNSGSVAEETVARILEQGGKAISVVADLTKKNTEMFLGAGVFKILTVSPHCLNALSSSNVTPSYPVR